MATLTSELGPPPGDIRSAYAGAVLNPHHAMDLFSLSAVAMGILSPGGYWLRVNGAMSAFFGYDEDAFLGLLLDDLTHPEDRCAVRAAHHRLVDAELERAGLDVRCLLRSGEMRWARFHLTALRLPRRTAMYTLVEIEDITALKAVESQERQRAEIYRAMIRNLPGAIVAVFDRDLRYIVVDGQGLADLGLSGAAFEGKTVWEAWGAEVGAETVERMRAVLAGRPQRYEVTIGEREFEVRAIPVAEDGGTIEVGVVIMHDITERKRHEREIQVASEALARSNRALEEFAVVSSHDLRAPLVSLHGLATILADEYRDKLDVEGRYILERVVANAGQMVGLLNDLLNVSRVGREDADFVPLDLAEVVAHVAEQQRFSLQRRGGELRIELDGVMVEANWTRMVQLFSNLIDNAIKYTPPERAPRIAISARQEGASWLVRVADNGVGIPEDHREDVFGMFQRLRSGKELNPSGTGMGLALVARIVQLHGGEIWIDPEAVTGTTFCFTLPKLDASIGKDHVAG